MDINFAMRVMDWEEGTQPLQLKKKVVVHQIWLGGFALLQCILYYKLKTFLQLYIPITPASVFLTNKIPIIYKSIWHVSHNDFSRFSMFFSASNM